MYLLVLYLPIYLIWFALVRAHGAFDGGLLCILSAAGRQDPLSAGVHSGVCALVSVFDRPGRCDAAQRTIAARSSAMRAFIIAGFSISLTICMIWPNCQLLRPVRGGHEHAVRLAGQCDLFGRHADERPAEYARGRLYGRAGRDVRQSSISKRCASRRSSSPLRSARRRCLSSSTPFWTCLRRSRCRWCCT